jgi:hypothetical protein
MDMLLPATLAQALIDDRIGSMNDKIATAPCFHW